MYMRPQIVPILVLALALLNGELLFAQSEMAGSNPPPPPQRTPGDLPIDQGVWFLLAIGIVLGIVVLRKKIKARNILD